MKNVTFKKITDEIGYFLDDMNTHFNKSCENCTYGLQPCYEGINDMTYNELFEMVKDEMKMRRSI